MPLGQLPPSMLQSLNLLPKDNVSVTLFTRHSIRHVATGKGLAGYDLQLTEEGIALAQYWGGHLITSTGRQVLSCTTSPIQRCIDTASHMLFGAYGDTTKIEIIQNNLLVEPGSFVEDHALASPFFRDLGALGFINQLIRNKLPGMKNSAQGVLDILNMVYALEQKQAEGLNLVVTHDTIIAVILSYTLGIAEVTSADWPKMMEGLFIWFDGDNFEESTMQMVWRGEQKQIVIAQLKEQIQMHHA